MILRKIAKLKALKESTQRDIDKAHGALDQMLSRLKEYGCVTEKEAANTIMVLKSEITKLEKIIEKELAELQEEYGDRL